MKSKGLKRRTVQDIPLMKGIKTVSNPYMLTPSSFLGEVKKITDLPEGVRKQIKATRLPASAFQGIGTMWKHN